MELSPHSPDFACCDFLVSRTKLFHTRNTFRYREARKGPYHRVPRSVPEKGFKEDFEECKKGNALQSTGTTVIFQ